MSVSKQDPSLPWHYSPSETALLLLDFHTSFVENTGGPDASLAVQNAADLRHWAKSHGMSVIHGLIDTKQDPFPTCKGAERLQHIVKEMLSPGGGAEESKCLVEPCEGPGEDITFLRMPGLTSALTSPGMSEYLVQKGIKSVLICGLSTSGCALRTAMAATDAKVVTTVISDACADPKREVHDMLLSKIIPSRAFVSTAAEFKATYQGRKELL